MQQKEVITHMLVGASAAVSQQMQTVLGEVMSVSEKLNEQSTMITDMTTQTFNTFDQLHAEAISMAEQHKSQERASALHIEEITQQTAKILERMQMETATLIAEQADKIKEQDYVIERMNEVS